MAQSIGVTTLRVKIGMGNPVGGIGIAVDRAVFSSLEDPAVDEEDCRG